MQRLKKLLRTMIIIIVLIGWVWAFNIWSNYQDKETPQQFVQRVHDFYIDTGYDKKSLYEADIEILQEYKQDAVDSLSYKQTIQYIAIQNREMSGMIDNDWLNYIDETLKLANEGKKNIKVPEYMTIDSKKALEEKKESPSDLVFKNLLK